MSNRDRDGVGEASGGATIEITNQDKSLLYSKILMIDSVIDVYDELKIYSIVNKNTSTENINYEKLPNYLHKAIYLDDDIIFIDKMLLPTKIIQFDSSDIVSFYTYLYCEIQEELGDIDKVDKDIKFIAEGFKYKYLNFESQLFDENDFDDIIFELKNTLEDIKINTFYKDSDFWLYCNAIEEFLYGDFNNSAADKSYWGANNFWAIWEDICTVYCLSKYPERIIQSTSKRIKKELIYSNIIDTDANIAAEEEKLPIYLVHENIDSENNQILSKRNLIPDIILCISTLSESKRFFENFNENILLDDGKNFHISFECKNDYYMDSFRNYMRGVIKHSTVKSRLGGHNKKKYTFKNRINKKIYQKNVKNSWLNYRSQKKERIDIVDFKYTVVNEYVEDQLSFKTKSDIIKQSLYEHICHQIYEDKYTYENYFLIPKYFGYSFGGDIKIEKGLPFNRMIQNLKIEIAYGDFMKFQKTYNEFE